MTAMGTMMDVDETAWIQQRAIVRSILHRHLSRSDWLITQPRDGQQKDCFIARYAEHITFDLAALEKQFRSLRAAELHTMEIVRAFERLQGWSKELQPATLVPIHPDPNTKNMLLSGDALVMVDWDDVQLSDPVRDAGLLLWWYVAPQQWREFFQTYGVAMNEAMIERIFWWAARTSFAIALWHVEHRYDCRPFLHDFLAALHKESNPHAVFDYHSRTGIKQSDKR